MRLGRPRETNDGRVHRLLPQEYRSGCRSVSRRRRLSEIFTPAQIHPPVPQVVLYPPPGAGRLREYSVPKVTTEPTTTMLSNAGISPEAGDSTPTGVSSPPNVDPGRTVHLRTSSQSLREPRYVWDPAVHEQWGEHCSYFLARFVETDSRSIESLLSQHLTRAKVSAFSIYVVFGYYDALIRTWLTPYKRTRLLEGLQDDADSLLEFQVDRVNYTWSQPSVAGRARIETLVPTIRAVAAALETPHELAGYSDQVCDGIRDLEEQRLLHRYPGSDVPNPIKFFIALSRTANTPESGDTLTGLTGIVDGLQGVHNVSIYAGRGFASYLIKGVTEHLGTVLQCADAVASHAKGLHLRPMTLMVANNDAFESDTVDTEWVEPDN